MRRWIQRAAIGLMLVGLAGVQAEDKPSDARVTVKAKEMPLLEVINEIAAAADISIFLHQDVKDLAVTFSVTDKPVRLVLDALAAAYDLVLEPIGDGEAFLLKKREASASSDSRVVSVDEGPSTPAAAPGGPAAAQPTVVIPPRAGGGEDARVTAATGPRTATALVPGAPGARSPYVEVKPPHRVESEPRRGLTDNEPQRIYCKYVPASGISAIFGGIVWETTMTGRLVTRKSSLDLPSTYANLGDTINRSDRFIGDLARGDRRLVNPTVRHNTLGRDQFGGAAGGAGDLFDGAGGEGGAGGAGGAGAALPLPNGVDLVIGYDLISALIVYGDEEGVNQLRRLIELIDIPPAQIEIEARFVTLSVNDADALGMVWSLTDGTNSISGSTPSGGGASLAFQTATGNFQALLTSIVRTNRGKIVNAPRVSTQNGQPAIVSFSQIIPVTISDTVITDASQTVSTDIATLQVDTFLTVVPRITGEAPDESITTIILPQISDVIGFVDNPSGGTIPIQAIENISTILRVRDGETIAMGGLIRKNNSESSTKIPLLGDLPFIGSLFRSRTRNLDESELLIFLTPRILRERLVGGPGAVR